MPDQARGEGCPPIDRLERLVADGAGDPDLKAHIESCETCRATIEEIRADNALLGRVAAQTATTRASGPRTALKEGAIPGYSIIREISRGGQGVVYLAIQTGTNRKVAIKVPLSGVFVSARQRIRFLREIQVVAAMRHPNIVTVFESGRTDDGRDFVAMEYVSGQSLDVYLKETLPRRAEGERPLLEARLRLIVKIARSLGHAHAKGIIHRDLKPSNILVDGADEPRMLDFGLAKTLATQAGEKPAMTHEFQGTPAYASPEQVGGSSEELDTRSDIYSLGVMMYEALTGRPPYDTSGAIAEVFLRIQTAEPARVSRAGAALPSDVETIVLKTLAKDPERRYQTADALAGDIDDFLSGRPISARRDSTWYVLSKLAGRHRSKAAVAAAFLVLLAGFAVGMALLARRLEVERAATAAALVESNLRQGRLLSMTGNTDDAEAILWKEFAAAGGDAADAGLGFTSPPAVMAPAWALFEVYSRDPRLSSFRVAPRFLVPTIDENTHELTFRWRDGAMERRRITGELLDSRASLGWDDGAAAEYSQSASGEVVLSMCGTRLRARDARAGVLIAERNDLPEGEIVYVSPDGLVGAYRDGSGILRILDVRTLKDIHSVDVKGPPGARIQFSPDSRRLFEVCQTQEGLGIAVIDTSSWKVSEVLPVPPSLRRAGMGFPLAINDGGTRIAISGDGAVAVWTVPGSGLPVEINDRSASLTSWQFTGDPGRLITKNQGGAIQVWDSDIKKGKRLILLGKGLAPAILCKDERTLVAARWTDGLVLVRDIGDEHGWIKRITPAGAREVRSVHSARFSADGRTVACGTDSGRVSLIDTQSGSAGVSWEAHAGVVAAVAWSGDGRLLATASFDGAVRLWNAGETTLKRELVRDTERSWHAVALSADGDWAAASGYVASQRKSVTLLWDLREEAGAARVLESAAQRVTQLAFSPDSRSLAATCATGEGNTGSQVAWDTVSGRELWRLYGSGATVRTVAFSHSGSFVAAGAADGTIRIRDATTGRVTKEFPTLPSDVFSLALHPAGRLLFAGATDGKIHVLDLATVRELAAIDAFTNYAMSLDVSPDGSTLVVGTGTGTVDFWDLKYWQRNLRGNAGRFMPAATTRSPATE